MPERAATVDSFEREGVLGALMRRALGRSPLDVIAVVLLVTTAGAILLNALYRQPGPHPAPIFSIKPRPVATDPPGGVVPALPRAKPEIVASAKPDAAATGRPRRVSGST